MTGRRVVPCGILVVALLGGCPKERSAPRGLPLSKVTVKDHTPGDLVVPGLKATDLRARVTARLAESKRFTVVSPDTEGAYRIKIDVGLRRDGADLVALVSARAESRRDDAAVLQSSGTARREGGGDVAKVRRAQLLDVLDRAADALVHQAMLAVAPPARVVAALGGSNGKKDLERLAAAIEIAAARRLEAAVPALIALLKHEHQPISDRAIGALVAIGDERAVKPLTRLSELSDTARIAKVVDAVGALGGKEAKDFLEFLAVGHPDQDIKNLAREALERMGRSRGRGPNKGR